ncbi:WxL protein peptidoglycan domain-containing protein [Enterococcus faecalis]
MMIKKIATTLTLLILSFISISSVYADDKLSSYSVSPQYSTHQSKDVENFFDIKWTPSSKENFFVKITNNTDKEQTYKIEVNKARTNKNGIIDYSDNAPEANDAKYKLTEMIDIFKEVKVPANSSENVSGSLTFPKEDFNGLLMAGIHVSEKKTEDSESNVSNSVAYNIPFVVRGNIDQRPKPILDLAQVKVEQFSSDTYSLDALLENKGPNLMKEVKFNSEIKAESGKSILKEDRQLDITPETLFAYPIKLPTTIKPGKYTLTLEVEHNKTNKWSFSKTFEVTKQDVKNIKATIPEKRNLGIVYAISTVIVIIMILILYRKRELSEYFISNNKRK